jgi:lipopolysaccharide export system permease protein
VTVYDRENGIIQYVITADSARYTGEGWELENPVRFDVAAMAETRLRPFSIAPGVTPDQFTLSDVNARSMNFLELRRAIADLEAAGRPTTALEAGLWHKISGPLSTILMPLLGAVAGFGLARSGQLFIRAIIGMALGFTYFVADNFALAMGNIGAYPPLLAAWAPFFLFLMIGEAVLIRTEE